MIEKVLSSSLMDMLLVMMNHSQVLDVDDDDENRFLDKQISSDENLKRDGFRLISSPQGNQLVGLLIKFVAVADKRLALPFSAECKSERIKRPERFCTFGVCC